MNDSDLTLDSISWQNNLYYVKVAVSEEFIPWYVRVSASDLYYRMLLHTACKKIIVNAIFNSTAQLDMVL